MTHSPPVLAPIGPRSRAFAVVLALHLMAAWALTQLQAVRQAVHQIAPVIVTLLRAPSAQPSAADSPVLPPPPRQAKPPPPLLPLAMPVPQQAVQAATLSSAVVPSPAPEAAAAPAAVAPAATATPPTAAPAAPPAAAQTRKLVSATAVRYLVEPPFEVPRAAKRAGESGTVVLRVVISSAGLPVSVTVHRSSGYARLDEQALWAMRQARFVPYSEGGRALEVEALAPVEYPAD